MKNIKEKVVYIASTSEQNDNDNGFNYFEKMMNSIFNNDPELPSIKQKLDNAKWIKEDLENLKYKISEIMHLEVGINLTESERSFDLAIYSKFSNIDDLKAYLIHPDHIKIANAISKVRNESYVVDYEI